MKEDKNLDRLFQEKFKDFESHPSDAVWKNIVASREEKNDRKAIPLWWKLGGVAAVLTLLFTLGTVLFNNSAAPSLDSNIVNTINQNEQVQETQLIEAVSQNNDVSEFVSIGNPNATDTNNATSKNNSARSGQRFTQSNLSQNQITTPPNTVTQTTTATRPNTTIKNESNDAIVGVQEQSNKTILLDEKQRQEVLQNEINETGSEVTQSSQDPKETALDYKAEKKSLIEEAKRIEEDKNETEAIALAEETPSLNRWGVGAIAAPVFYGDFGGSGIDPSFSDNTKTGDVNFSYGVQVSYAVSPKLKVRTGVSNVDLSYNTGGIEFNAAADARSLSGINFNENARALNIADAGSAAQNAVQDQLFPENGNTQRAINGSLQQRIGFVEIPVEAVYIVSDKRVGVQVVGGLSTLFLNNNEVILNSADGLQSNLGSATGVNDLSFTTNIGLGLDYKMTDNLKLNVEPSLKYQLNAFDESVGDFKPYFIGLYTGVSYRF